MIKKLFATGIMVFLPVLISVMALLPLAGCTEPLMDDDDDDGGDDDDESDFDCSQFCDRIAQCDFDEELSITTLDECKDFCTVLDGEILKCTEYAENCGQLSWCLWD